MKKVIKTVLRIDFDLQGKQYVNGYYPDIGNFPLMLPTGDYVLLLTWSFYKRIQFVTNVYFTFLEDILKM